MAYIFDPLQNTFIDDEDTSLGNKLQIANLVDDLQPGPLKDELQDNFDPSQETYEEYLQRKSLGERPFNAADGGMIRQNFGDGTPTKRTDGKYSVRLKDFSKPVGPDGNRPRVTYVGTLSYINNLIKQNKKQANLARLEQGVKSSEARATWLKDYGLDKHEADVKNGKTRLEIANNLYNSNKAYYDNLNKKLFDPNNPTSVSRIQAALRSRTDVSSKGNLTPATTKRYNTINKLSTENVAKYEKELKKAHNAAKNWINKNKSKYKKTIIPGQVTGTLSNFENDFFKYMNDNFSRFVKYTTGTTNEPIKNLPYIDRFSEAFDYKASNQGMHRIALRTQLRKALGIFKEKGLNKSESFERRQTYIKKLLPIAQKNGVVPKYWTPKGGKFANKKIPITAANYQTYVDTVVRNPMIKIFNNLVNFSSEHIGGVARAAKILDSDALGKVIAMEFGEIGNANLLKGTVIDGNIGDALEAAMNEDPNNKKKIKEHINVANDFANKANKKYGIPQAKYSAVVEDGKVKIKTKYPKISLNDSLLNKTKNAIHSFIANDGMNRKVFNELPIKLKEGITLISKNKNADSILKSHIKDIFPEEGKGIKFGSFAGAIDFDLIPENVKTTVAKGANALGKSLKVLGAVTAPLDVIPFSEQSAKGLRGTDLLKTGAAKLVEGYLNTPQSIADLFGKKLYEPFTAGTEYADKIEASIPMEERILNQKNLAFDKTMPDFVDDTEIPPSKKELEEMRKDFIENVDIDTSKNLPYVPLQDEDKEIELSPITKSLVTPDQTLQDFMANGGRVGFSNGGAAGADDDFAAQLEYFFLNPDAELPAAKTFRETMNPVSIINDMIDPRNIPYYADRVVQSGIRIGEFGARVLPAVGQLAADLIQRPAFKIKPSTNQGYVQDYTDQPLPLSESRIEGTGIFTDFLNNLVGSEGTDMITEKSGLGELIESEEQKMKDRRATAGAKILADQLTLGMELTAPIFPGYKLLEAYAKSRKLPVDKTTRVAMDKEIDEVLSAQGTNRRDFLKVAGAGGAVMIAKMLGFGDELATATKVAEKAAPKAPIVPQYFYSLVDKIKRSGEDQTKLLATQEREIVTTYRTPSADYELFEDLNTGSMQIKIRKGDPDGYSGYKEEELTLTKGQSDESAGIVPDEYDEFTVRADNDGKMKNVDQGLEELDELFEEIGYENVTIEDLKAMGYDIDRLPVSVQRKLGIKEPVDPIKRALKNSDDDLPDLP